MLPDEPQTEDAAVCGQITYRERAAHASLARPTHRTGTVNHHRYPAAKGAKSSEDGHGGWRRSDTCNKDIHRVVSCFVMVTQSHTEHPGGVPSQEERASKRNQGEIILSEEEPSTWGNQWELT